MQQAVRYLLFTLPALLIALLVCYVFLDKPVAVDMSQLVWLKQNSTLGPSKAVLMTQACYVLMLFVFLIYFFRRLKGKVGKHMNCLALLCQSVVFAFFTKNTLQYLFGRYVPRYKNGHTLLFERNHHLYGFHWLQGGSFPSGHMAVLSAAVIAITVFYPKFKWVAIALMLLMAVLLILLNYHFLSDVLAGAYLGVSISLALYHVGYSKSFR